MSGFRKAVRFWDAINGDPDDAEPIGEGESIQYALEVYAESDHDGLSDGLYVDARSNTANPHPFIVEYSDGTRETWEVFGELTVDFYAIRPRTTDAQSVTRGENE